MSPAQTTPLVTALEKLGAHDHLCSIYESQQEQFAVAVAFIRSGIDRGEKCIYILDDGTEDIVRNTMHAEGMDVQRAVASNALVLMTNEQAYVKQGSFDFDWMSTFWREAGALAVSQGFSALRVIGATEWILGGVAGLERWMEYESRLTHTLSESNCLALCQYRRQLFPPELILDVIRTHPIVIHRGTVCRNMYHIPPDEFLKANQTARKLDRLLSNILDREQVAYALRQQRNELRDFRFIVEGVKDYAIFSLDAEGCVSSWNAGAERIKGYREEEILGQRYSRFYPAEDVAQGKPDEQLRVAASAGRIEDEGWRLRKDGSRFWANVVITALRDETGKLLGFAKVVRDITKRKWAEGLLREATERVEMILDSITDNFFGLSSDGRFVYFNRNAAKQMQILGKDPAHLIGKVAWEEFPDMPNKKNVQRVLTERVPITDELYYPPLGEWVENHMYPSHDGGFVTFQRYVTDRKRVEEELRRSEAFLAEGQRISHIGSWAVKFPSEDVFWSQEVFRIYGLDPATTKLSQQMAFQLIHPEDRLFVKEAFERALRDKSDYAVEHRAILADGSIKHLHALGHPVLNESGDLIEYVGTVVDITEHKRAEETLRKAEAELARVTRVTMMGELTASIAHEVNQPLAAIVTNGSACLRWLAGPAPNEREAQKAVNRIIVDANRASQVIQRILALVKKTDIEKGWLDVNKVIHEVLTLAHSEVRRNRVSLRTDLAETLPAVLGDRIELQQVFLNLVMNAIEAMSAVVDRLRELLITSRGDERDRVVVTVRDSGVGLAPQCRNRIFDAFYTTKPEGVGMGLAISRSIVEAHGGRLWATPNDGPGETFHFTLPVGAPGAP